MKRVIWSLLFGSVMGCAVPSTRYYTLQKGDDPARLAELFNVDVNAVRKFNRQSRWVPGEKIYIPYESRRLSRQIARDERRDRQDRKPNVLEEEAAKGADFRKMGLHWPVTHPVVTSGFGVRGYRFHEGIDLSAPRHTPVYSSGSGKVIYASSKLAGYGRMVIIDHGKRVRTVYAHLQKISVQPNESVKRGQMIGSVGSSGKATGPHLHFEVRNGTKPHNPEYYLPPRKTRNVASQK